MQRPQPFVAFWLGVALLAHAELALLLGVGRGGSRPRRRPARERRGGGESIDVGMVDGDAARQILADLERQDGMQGRGGRRIESVKSPDRSSICPPRARRRGRTTRASRASTTAPSSTR
jgi:hypothetical protein